MFLKNKPDTKIFRRNLRKNQTDAEKKIWDIVRNRKIQNLKFFRQFGIGKYIIDFYCPSIKLAIEIDGGQHNEKINIAGDIQRTQYLESFGIKVLRFWNNDIFENIEGVYGRIVETINSPRPSL